MRLRAKVINLIQLNCLQYKSRARRIREVIVMQDEVLILDVWVLVDMVCSLGIE